MAKQKIENKQKLLDSLLVKKAIGGNVSENEITALQNELDFFNYGIKATKH